MGAPLRVVPNEGTDAPWTERINDFEDRIRECRRTLCVQCASASCEVAQGCAHRGSDLPVDGTPACQWATEIVRERRLAERAEARAHALWEAGYQDRERLIPAISRAITPPIPDRRVIPAGFTEMWAAVREYLTNQKLLNLTLVGGTGVGKSWATAWLIAAQGGVFLHASVIAKGSEEWKSLKPRARATHQLVIEDLGLEHDEWGWAKNEIDNLLTYRSDQGRRTAVSTNLLPRKRFDWPKDQPHPETIEGRYTARVLDRLTGHDFGALLVNCGNVSLRQKEM